MAVGLVLLAGTWTDPWLWAYVVAVSSTTLYAMFCLDDDLARERFHPPNAGADRLSLRSVRLAALAHIVVAVLDSWRWHITHVAPGIRGAALAGMLITFAFVFRAMRENRFFSAVVRIQTDRGHTVVSSGPYSVIRHPGYLGMIAGVPLSGLALGSWMGALVGLLYSGLILRRVMFEDRFLQHSLEGYEDYARQVRYRLVPGLW